MIIKERSPVILPFHPPLAIVFIEPTQVIAAAIKAVLVVVIVIDLELPVVAITAEEVPSTSVLGADLKLMEELSSMSSSQRLSQRILYSILHFHLP